MYTRARHFCACRMTIEVAKPQIPSPNMAQKINRKRTNVYHQGFRRSFSIWGGVERARGRPKIQELRSYKARSFVGQRIKIKYDIHRTHYSWSMYVDYKAINKKKKIYIEFELLYLLQIYKNINKYRVVKKRP